LQGELDATPVRRAPFLLRYPSILLVPGGRLRVAHARRFTTVANAEPLAYNELPVVARADEMQRTSLTQAALNPCIVLVREHRIGAS
jgi:hypothetical protein